MSQTLALEASILSTIKARYIQYINPDAKKEEVEVIFYRLNHHFARVYNVLERGMPRKSYIVSRSSYKLWQQGQPIRIGSSGFR